MNPHTLRKLQLRREDKLKDDMRKSLVKQGFYAEKVSDRFKAGRPDLRLGHHVFGPLDVELKFNPLPAEEFLDPNTVFDSGMTKLQWLKIREMNQHGMPAICLIYYDAFKFYGVHTLLRDTLPPEGRRVKLPQTGTIDGQELVSTARKFLNDSGYVYP